MLFILISTFFGEKALFACLWAELQGVVIGIIGRKIKFEIWNRKYGIRNMG